MFYVNINKVPVAVADLPIHAKCPVCKTEFEVPEFWEMITDVNGADLLDDASSMYCDDCSAEYERIRETMQIIHPDADELTVQHYSEAMQKRLHDGLTV